jgi:hypothetical protein
MSGFSTPAILLRRIDHGDHDLIEDAPRPVDHVEVPVCDRIKGAWVDAYFHKLRDRGDEWADVELISDFLRGELVADALAYRSRHRIGLRMDFNWC